MSENKCWNCEDMGIVGGCPECGKTLVKVKIVPEVSNIEEIVNIIPEAYRGVWDSDILKNSFSEYENDKPLIDYIKSLNALVNVFREGKLPKKSVLILSSIGMGKTTCAYYCMNMARTFGYKIAPIIDNTEYRRLNNLSTDVMLYKNYLKRNQLLPSIEDIMDSDIQFMVIDPVNVKDAHRDIYSLVSKRDRRGKPTIILSNNSINQLVVTDFEQEFTNLLSKPNLSMTKQISVLQCFLR